VGGEVEFSFWHATIRDVAYAQIPRGVRAEKHRAVALWIEQIVGERVIDHAEVLAYHHQEAIKLARSVGNDELADRLVEALPRFLELAGDRLALLDLVKADDYYERALTYLPGGDKGRAGLLLKRMQTFGWLPKVSWDESERIFQEACEIYQKAGDSFGLGWAHICYTPPVYYSGDPVRAGRMAEEGLRLLEQHPPGPKLAKACIEVAGRRQGAESVALAEKALAHAADDEDRRAALEARGVGRIALGDLGGRADLLHALEFAREAGLSAGTVASLNDLGVFDALLSGPGVALDWAEKAMALSANRGMEGSLNWNKGTSMLGRFELGRWDDVLRVGEEVLVWEHANQPYLSGLNCLAYMVAVLTWRGEFEAAGKYEKELVERARPAGDQRALTFAALNAYLSGARSVVPDRLREIENIGTRQRENQWALSDTVRLALACGELGLAEELRELEPGIFPRGQIGLLTIDAALAEAHGEQQSALRAYRQAAARWHDWGFPLEEALALIGAARCGGAADERSRGQALLTSLGVRVNPPFPAAAGAGH